MDLAQLSHQFNKVSQLEDDEIDLAKTALLIAALSKKLVGHPGRRTVMPSRHAIDYFNLKLSFTSHRNSSL